MAVSKGRINRAGEALRDWWIEAAPPSQDLLEAFGIVAAYRQVHGYPLTLVTGGLRSFVQREPSAGNIGQRLKRMDRIIQKLARFPEMKLARMQDVAGCRAVLESASEVDGVARRVRSNWDVVREKDYRDGGDPDTGYRAVHLVVKRTPPGTETSCLVEVQLRTRGQHLWAERVERVAARTGEPLKDGAGPPELLDYFRVMSQVIASIEAGAVPDASLVERYALLHRAVTPYLGPGR